MSWYRNRRSRKTGAFSSDIKYLHKPSVLSWAVSLQQHWNIDKSISQSINQSHQSINVISLLSVGSGGSSIIQTDIQERSQNLRHFYPGMGLKLGYSGFSRDQNNCDNLNTPNLSPMADDAITRGGVRGLGSLLYICNYTSGQWAMI